HHSIPLHWRRMAYLTSVTGGGDELVEHDGSLRRRLNVIALALEQVPNTPYTVGDLLWSTPWRAAFPSWSTIPSAFRGLTHRRQAPRRWLLPSPRRVGSRGWPTSTRASSGSAPQPEASPPTKKLVRAVGATGMPVGLAAA